MAVEYVTARFPEGEVPRFTDRSAAMKRATRFAGESRLRSRPAGGDHGEWLDNAQGLARFQEETSAMPVGQKLILQREGDLEQLSCRKVEKEEVAEAPLTVAPEVGKVHAAVWAKFDVRSGGRWYCRYVDGTTTVSKHGYFGDGWQGAAEDVFVNEGGMERLKQVADFIVEGHQRGLWSVATVIVENRIWTPDAWRDYGGKTHYHVHLDVAGGRACQP